MTRQIYVNLPVKDLNRSIAFFTHLGFDFNQQFTDETATCLVLGENIFAMLITEKRFAEFTKKPISDARTATEVLIALDAESREAVDELVKKVIEAGGQTSMPPVDHGWMYYQSFEDLDGHQWEIGYMDTAAMPPKP